MGNADRLSSVQTQELFKVLKKRFEQNMLRHEGVDWSTVQAKLEEEPEKIWSLNQMEISGGEPDVITSGLEKDKSKINFYDCAVESPKGRRSICYDEEARESRKKFKPEHSAIGMAAKMGIELLNEEQYRVLQQVGNFDTKTSSWILTPKPIREEGGAIFGDWRYGIVFVYHNGAESYYGARGFRGILKV